eukprot:TRINITY_DN1143_c0_g4_i1.p1 TRINITY_DN1143_c0_g4~~TRINITY_DN1143_c0_g4_i1.p1  ORF type:complete len:311 (+),score=75.88 TRINITY_DN1143_c0_g4_i1:73-1005(+)
MCIRDRYMGLGIVHRFVNGFIGRIWSMQYKMYKEIGKLVAKSQRLFIFTGSGVSAPSNIPPYNGPKGLWEVPPTQIIDPMNNLTKHRLDFNQKPIWNWVRAYRTFLADARPNPAHEAILRLQEHYTRLGRELTLATQSLDGLHALLMSRSEVLSPSGPKKVGEPQYGFVDDLIELHGNLNYMSCLDECHASLYDIPHGLKENEVPKCPQCEQPMRPHMLLYDEYYSEYRQKSNTMMNKALGADCMLVIATSLRTQLPYALVYEHVDEGKTTVEINTEKVINMEMKNMHHITEPCEKAVPLLVEEIISSSS